MTVAEPNPDQVARMRFIDDQLAGWPNDDLLLDDDSRRRLGVLYPALVPVFAWDALRDEFRRHDAPAMRAQAVWQRFGASAVLVSAAGLILVALTSALPQDGRGIAVLRGGAELLLIAGAVIGFGHWLGARSKMVWLGHRFAAERLRQFYHQSLLGNLDLVAAAIADPAAIPAWHANRERHLRLFLDQYLHDLPCTMDRMTDDDVEREEWLEDAVPRPAIPSDPALAPALEQLLAIMRRQRLVIQGDYVARKTRPSLKSPTFRATAARNTADLLTLGVLILSAVTGFLLLRGGVTADLSIRLALCASAIASAIVLMLRVLGEGFQIHADSERYAWYAAVIRHSNDRFRSADTAGKVAALYDLERAAYQELRRFIMAHRRARFIL